MIFYLIPICYYDAMTNNFPGEIFKYVHEVELFDERHFEYEIFLRIEKSFPFMEELTLRNEKRQINKQFIKSKQLSIIKYPYRKRLNLIHSCIDYYEQFLFDTITRLSVDVRVLMDHELVKKMARTCTRNRTRSNCKN